MVRSTRSVSLAASVTAIVVTLLLHVSAGVALAQETVQVDGLLEYDPPPPGQVVESVGFNLVSFTFDPAGGPFEGTAQLDLIHDVPGRGCVFNSSHIWEYSGTFERATHQFLGTYRETVEMTTGECENFTFTRTFTPDEGELKMSLNPATGEIRSQVPPLRFTVNVDPTLFESDDPEPSPGPTDQTDPGSTPGTTGTPSSGPEPPPGETSDDDGIPPFALFLIFLLLLAAGFGGWRAWNQRKTPIEDDEGEGNCSDEEQRYREAKRMCDEATQRARDSDERHQQAQQRLKEAQSERASLPSEETRVELPDGRSLSQLDLHLRRQAAADAWASYLADPSPESAAAAEDAWERQATPEWLDEQRKSHEDRKHDLDNAIEDARSEAESASADRDKARSGRDELCAEAEAARREWEECLRRSPSAGAGAPPGPSPLPPESSGPPLGPPPPTPPPPPVSAGPTPPAGEPDEPKGKCRDGDERWVEFDGPHPFTIPTDGIIRVQLVLIAGTTRSSTLGSLGRAKFTQIGGPGQVVGIAMDMLEGASDAELRDAFSGEGGLSRAWETAGAGAVQRLSLSLTWETRRVLAACERKEICVSGEWQPSTERRATQKGPTESSKESLVVSGNLEAGLGRTEEDYLSEIVSFLSKIRGQVIVLRDAQRQLDSFRRACAGGKRG